MTFLNKIRYNPVLPALIIVLAFIVIVTSFYPIKLQQMGSSALFVFDVFPIYYWIGIAAIGSTIFLALRYLDDNRFRVLVVFSSIVLMFSIRLAFPMTFASVPSYEPDAANYMNIVNSWVHSGINLGVDGNYQHNFPMSFLIAYVFVKLGVPTNSFFKIAPFVIYAIEMILLYLTVAELFPQAKKYAAVSAFLFSFSSLGYWITVHYSPDLIGTLFYFVSLLLAVRFALKGEWSVKGLLPVLLSIAILIFSHHLSILFFTLTLLGLAFSTWFFKTPQFKGGWLSFLILAVLTYNAWFAWGSFYYPKFFSIYIYWGSSGNVTSLSQGAGLINNITFAIYPALILGLFLIEFLRTSEVKSPKIIFHLPGKIKEIRRNQYSNLPFVYSTGFLFIFLLFLIGFGITALNAPRILEVFCIGIYPLASLSLMKIYESSPSKKKIFLMTAIIVIIIVISAYRYDTQIQRRVT